LTPQGAAAGKIPPGGDLDARLHRAIGERVGTQRYELWFPGRVRFVADGEALAVGAANLILQNFVQRSFDETIRAVARDEFGRPIEVRYRIDPELLRPSPAEQAKAAQKTDEAKGRAPERDLFTGAKARPVKPSAAKPAPAEEPAKSERPEQPKRRWRHLHDFVVGTCNRVAHAAAAAVIDEPGQGPNPLVIHGPVGTGKSHLLEGVYAGLRRRNPTMRVIFASAEDFTNRFVAAVRFGKQSSFRRHFRGGDAFLLDDLHFLARKRATQEEFLHTLDSLVNDGKQVVLTCDSHPRLNDEFLPELTDRLLGGATWGLQPPDGETRLSLLRAKSGGREEKSTMADDVLLYLSERLRGNVRELEGALHSLRHYARVTGRTIDREMAAEALGDLLRHAVRVVRVEDVDAAVCGVLRLPAGTLQGKERSWSVSHPRMLAVFLSRKHTAASYGEISKHFGGKGHSSAVASEKKVRAWLKENAAIGVGGREWAARELLERLERELLS